LTNTCAQGSDCCARASKKATGLRPPDTTRVALPRASMAWRNAPATRRANASASCPASAWLQAMTPCGSSSSEIPIPVPPVTGNQGHGGHRPPASGCIGFRRLTETLPAGNQLVAPLPGMLDFVLAHKQVLIAAHHFQQQTFVGIGNPFTAVGI